MVDINFLYNIIKGILSNCVYEVAGLKFNILRLTYLGKHYCIVQQFLMPLLKTITQKNTFYAVFTTD